MRPLFKFSRSGVAGAIVVKIFRPGPRFLGPGGGGGGGWDGLYSPCSGTELEPLGLGLDTVDIYRQLMSVQNWHDGSRWSVRHDCG